MRRLKPENKHMQWLSAQKVREAENSNNCGLLPDAKQWRQRQAFGFGVRPWTGAGAVVIFNMSELLLEDVSKGSSSGLSRSSSKYSSASRGSAVCCEAM